MWFTQILQDITTNSQWHHFNNKLQSLQSNWTQVSVVLTLLSGFIGIHDTFSMTKTTLPQYWIHGPSIQSLAIQAGLAFWVYLNEVYSFCTTKNAGITQSSKSGIMVVIKECLNNISSQNRRIMWYKTLLGPLSACWFENGSRLRWPGPNQTWYIHLDFSIHKEILALSYNSGQVAKSLSLPVRAFHLQAIIRLLVGAFVVCRICTFFNAWTYGMAIQTFLQLHL